MHCKLFATLAETAGQRDVELAVEAEDPTLRDGIDALLAAEPALEAEILDGDELQPHIRLLCDGENPFDTADGWNTALSSVEEIALFPPVTGG
jgi:molybdopterin synthase sulfur carrier subunit